MSIDRGFYYLGVSGALVGGSSLVKYGLNALGLRGSLVISSILGTIIINKEDFLVDTRNFIKKHKISKLIISSISLIGGTCLASQLGFESPLANTALMLASLGLMHIYNPNIVKINVEYLELEEDPIEYKIIDIKDEIQKKQSKYVQQIELFFLKYEKNVDLNGDELDFLMLNDWIKISGDNLFETTVVECLWQIENTLPGKILFSKIKNALVLKNQESKFFLKIRPTSGQNCLELPGKDDLDKVFTLHLNLSRFSVEICGHHNELVKALWPEISLAHELIHFLHILCDSNATQLRRNTPADIDHLLDTEEESLTIWGYSKREELNTGIEIELCENLFRHAFKYPLRVNHRHLKIYSKYIVNEFPSDLKERKFVILKNHNIINLVKKFPPKVIQEFAKMMERVGCYHLSNLDWLLGS